MSDHGPRLDMNFKNSEHLIEGSIQDNNLYGYFVYRIKTSKTKDNKRHVDFKTLVPSSKKRYAINDYGIAREVNLFNAK